MTALKLTRQGDRWVVEVHVVPRASRSAVVGEHDGRVKVALLAPPVDGAANEALVRFFADALGIRQRDVEIVRGHRSRQKCVALSGVSEAAVRALCASA
jgi:uncharacterized protein (TIGR00251 family)